MIDVAGKSEARAEHPAMEAPSWMATLVAAFRWGEPDPLPRPEAVAGAGWAVGAPAFAELLLPLVAEGRRQVGRCAEHLSFELAAGVHARFERALLEQLVRICAQPLNALFAAYLGQRGLRPALVGIDREPTGDPHYREFVGALRRNKLIDFFYEFSDVARSCAVTVRTWITFVVEFLERLAADREALEETFAGGSGLGPVVDVTVALCDVGAGRRGVIVTAFANGTCLVYELRSLVAPSYSAQLAPFRNGAGLLAGIRAVKALYCAGYGWLEWIGAGAEGGPELSLPAPLAGYESRDHVYARAV
jgi:lantibiotic modifying enzyme